MDDLAKSLNAQGIDRDNPCGDECAPQCAPGFKPTPDESNGDDVNGKPSKPTLTCKENGFKFLINFPCKQDPKECSLPAAYKECVTTSAVSSTAEPAGAVWMRSPHHG